MEQTLNRKERKSLISLPLLKQTIKANWLLWLMLTIGAASIFFVINVVVTSKNIFTNINMDNVSIYMTDEGLSWFQILGLMEKMGYSLSRIAVMSRVDLNSIISDLVYKIAGVLLPMIYVMITANSLIANQVSSGSLAYVLSTPTSRKKVVLTSYVFLIGSLIAMYLVITLSAMSSELIAQAIRSAAGGAKSFYPVRTLLLCLSSFSALFALGGICFGASAFFNKANNSIAVGGGVCVLSFLCVILGLFGNTIFVSVGVGVEAMNIFNYATIFSLIDTDSIGGFAKSLAGVDDAIFSLNWAWEIGIMIAIGAVTAILGSLKFLKKDLPL